VWIVCVDLKIMSSNQTPGTQAISPVSRDASLWYSGGPKARGSRAVLCKGRRCFRNINKNHKAKSAGQVMSLTPNAKQVAHMQRGPSRQQKRTTPRLAFLRQEADWAVSRLLWVVRWGHSFGLL
jgi:hypothetical protein